MLPFVTLGLIEAAVVLSPAALQNPFETFYIGNYLSVNHKCLWKRCQIGAPAIPPLASCRVLDR